MGSRLVRDRALNSWVVPGAEHQVRPVEDDEEHLKLLRAKLIEEAMEVVTAETREEVMKEIADVLSVLQAIADKSGLSWYKEVIDMQEFRDAQSGSFRDGMVWDTSR